MFTTDVPTPGQRCVMLAAVDAYGQLPADANRRVLNSIPETWARTDEESGGRFLTADGRAALAPLGRFYLLERAHPDGGGVPSMNGRGDALAMLRDGLVVFQDAEGRAVSISERWDRGVWPRITERGRKLVGMPLTAPPFSVRLPVRSQAVWRREGQPDRPVQVNGWPFDDGTVRVLPLDTPLNKIRETRAPAKEIHPVPARPIPTETHRSDDGEKTMTSKPELDLDDELEALRGLAAAAVKPMKPGSETWEQVKVLQERADSGYELAERFTEFDKRATANRWAPREWRRGRDLSAEEVAELIEQWPDLAALGSTFVRSLAAAGFAHFQMANLVKQVQGRRDLPEIKAGDVVEAMLAGGGEPKTIRLKVDRTPWPGGPDSTVLSDGTAVTTVVTSSVQVVEDDGTTTTARLVTDES